MNMSNIQALMRLKDEISYSDSLGNLHHDFSALIEYTYNNQIIKEQHKCEVINIVGYSDIGLRINSHSNEINSKKLHTEFLSPFGSFVFDNNNRILTIQQSNSPKIGPYMVKLYLI
jgi:hypothetical protein